MKITKQSAHVEQQYHSDINNKEMKV